MSHNMQAFIDALSDGLRSARSNYHLTLGQLVEKLSTMRGKAAVRISDQKGVYPGEALSYRGYYEDLCFETTDRITTVSQLLIRAKSSLGRSFDGYKGGEYVMGEDTPLWISDFGSASGRAIIGIEELPDRDVMLIIKQVD